MPTITYRKDTAPVLTPKNPHYHFVLITIINGDTEAVIYTDRDDAMAAAKDAAMENLRNDMEEIPLFPSIDDLLEFHNERYQLDSLVDFPNFVDVRPSRIF